SARPTDAALDLSIRLRPAGSSLRDLCEFNGRLRLSFLRVTATRNERQQYSEHRGEHTKSVRPERSEITEPSQDAKPLEFSRHVISWVFGKPRITATKKGLRGRRSQMESCGAGRA